MTHLKIGCKLTPDGDDKNIWLYARRLKRNIKLMKDIGNLIASGQLIIDNECAAVVNNARWLK